MANYTQVSYGSQGDEVKKLQELLNQNGATLDVDGVFGDKTQQAVKDYQTANNILADGIVGENTWSALSGGANSNTANDNTANDNTQNTTQNAAGDTATNTPDYSKYTYDSSTNTAYMEALAALQQASQMKPTYQASYDSQLQEIYDQIVNRDKFSYNLNEDALYQQYADQYQLMGQQASMDVMGQAAALTGGYGNSYATTAGNQAYQAYLQKLNEVVPELYGRALDQYNAEGDKLLTQYSMLGDMADREYSKYMDNLNQYWQNVTFAQQQADNAYDRGYNEWLNNYQMGVNADEQAYNRQQNAYNNLISLITTAGYEPTDEELAQAGMSREQYQALKDYYDKQNLSSTSSGSGVNNGKVTAANIKTMQLYLGLSGSGLGKWGPNSQKAAKEKWGVTSADDAWAKYLESVGYSETPTTYDDARNSVSELGGDPNVVMDYDEFLQWQQDKSENATAYSSYEEYLRDVVTTVKEQQEEK